VVHRSTTLRYTHHVTRRRKSSVGKPRARPAILRPLGAQLRRLRLERRLSQERLAELSGLGYKYIGQVELAKMEPGADALVRLARGLAVPVGELFETITPARQQPYRLSLPDLDTVTLALTSLTTVLDRVRAGQAAPLPSRAPRGSRR